MKTSVILLSAGSSTRFGGDIKKQFYLINNKPLLYYSLLAFDESKRVDEIIVVTAKEDIERVQEIVKQYGFNKVKCVISGGDTRQESVHLGLAHVESDFVLVHDAARPLVSEEIISNLLDALKDADGSTPVLKVVDTIIKVENKELSSYEDRNQLFRVQTPQAFKTKLLKKAHEQFLGKNITDDSQLIKLVGGKVAIVEGDEKLRKVTTLEDTYVIKTYIEQDERLQN